MIVIIVTGVILILFFIILQYLKSKCHKKIEATYLKCNTYISGTGGHGLITQYAPVFKYRFNGKEYEKQTFQTFSKKAIKDLIVGKNYIILINEKNPKIFILNKKLEIAEIIILLLGIFFILTGILVSL